MIFQTSIDQLPVSVSLTNRAVTVSRDDEFIVAWDLGGRLYSVVDGERTYRRGLNGRVLVKWREKGERQRAWASEAEAAALIDRAAALGSALRDVPDVAAEMRQALARAAAFDSAAACRDAARFHEVYQPIGILPPDQYLALVLQATEGCSFRSCTFCDLYHEGYRVKDAPAFAQHLARVREYLGDSLRLRDRTVFLGSANALAVPMSGLEPLFDILVAELPGTPVYAFVDGFTGVRKSIADYRLLGQRGLRRVYIGLESGHDPLLSFVRKPATSAQALESVRDIKAAGVHVGVIVMVGLGGDRFADAHVVDTAGVVNGMALGAGDLLYFSELVESPDTSYGSTAAVAGIRPLDREERAAQRRAIEDRLAFTSSAPRMATYDIREFVY